MLKEISIDELAVGMYVHSIATQTGDLKIKTRGMVSSWDTIRDLKRKGIQSLIIDPEKQKQRQKSGVPEVLPDEDKDVSVSYDTEIGRARFLHDQGKVLMKRLLTAMELGSPPEPEVVDEYADRVIASSKRNPDALMTLTRIRDKGGYQMEHATNVSVLMARFAQFRQMSEGEVHALTLAGLMHDLGMVLIPDSLLEKEAALSAHEREMVQTHVEKSLSDLRKQAVFPAEAIQAIAEHHERLDGSGYPDGLKGDHISLYGRMLAIVDSFDAMTAERPYRKAMPTSKALKILLQAPELYDETLVQQFVKCVGVYPTGSLVRLDNGKVGMVIRQNEKLPLQPRIKVFYSQTAGHYLPPKVYDLATPRMNFDIERAILPEELGIDFVRFFNTSIAP
ncbi:HD-GYP domain-containing protein [Bowmanella dokdonensis]|uniref:HD-GYP domain-containing protein n=1 Tax=Bowmanella dokdonensis TaxID=751969 RepID=A0A939IRU0_9ALTE|nr:HD-GYP domain-containing protein [Bowmanella dokdonensis]MBN7825841.1 HD-GYP domain-containing protein [Bowmanella dokdonensis]